MNALSDLSREGIILRTGELLQMNGDLSFPLLAARLGCAESRLHQLFPDIDALLSAVFFQHVARHLSVAVAALDETPRRPLRSRLMHFALCLLRTQESAHEVLNVYRLVITHAVHSHIGGMFYEVGWRQTLEQLTQALDRAMMRCELRQADPHLLAQRLLALLNYSQALRLPDAQQPVSGCALRRQAREAVDIFLAGAKRRVK